MTTRVHLCEECRSDRAEIFLFRESPKKEAKKSAIFCLRDDEKQNNRHMHREKRKGFGRIIFYQKAPARAKKKKSGRIVSHLCFV